MKYILDFNEVSMSDKELVGGKNASLGEMIQFMTPIGINVPRGFAVTTEAYDRFIQYNNLKERIESELTECNVDDIENLSKTGMKIRQMISDSEFPEDIELSIKEAYKKLSLVYDQDSTDVAVRSSATAEDLPDASFAGQQETYLNVRNSNDLISCVRKCWASLFTDRAISYRSHFKYDHFNVKLSVGVQKMARTDLGVSGVAFSIDTESGFKDVVLINASWGLGELIVQGSISPDEFLVFKPTLEGGFSSIIEKKLGNKDIKMIYDTSSEKRVKTIHVEKENQRRFCLSDSNILKIADWVTKIENYYTELKGSWCPMDVEWGIDGLTGDLFILQARPETIHSRKKNSLISEYRIQKTKESKIIAQGIAVGSKISSGKVKVLYSLDGRDGTLDGRDFREGDILVTEMTDPDWEPLMKKASAIITDKGGRTCHASIIAREMGIPAIVGTLNASEKLQSDQLVTVSCAEGDIGYVYEGQIPYERSEIDLSGIPQTKTPIMLNIGSPEIAFNFASYPQKGVGLAREEFIINNFIKVHPLALLNHRSLNDEELSEKISDLTWGYNSEEEYFIKKLSYGIAKIASAYYPNKVIVRFSDFKTNEYYNMIGGKYFEPIEENPMIGWRGASRYYDKEYKAAFIMECKAIKRVREKMGLQNVQVMIPFCRTVEELKKVLGIMEDSGLGRSGGMEVFLMAELPSNIILADKFADYVDGFSIGSNDLTQLVLGLDRDSALVSHIYDERNEAVKSMISHLIKVAKSKGKKVGICGQGPSDFPDFAQFLVKEGIDSISVTPDSFLRTYKAIYEVEKNISKDWSDEKIDLNSKELKGEI